MKSCPGSVRPSSEILAFMEYRQRGRAQWSSRKALAAAFNIDASDLDSPEETMTTKYEYRVVRFDMKWSSMGYKLGTDFAAMEKEMNVLGAEGWELVKLSDVIAGQVYTAAFIATFKRVTQ